MKVTVEVNGAQSKFVIEINKEEAEALVSAFNNKRSPDNEEQIKLALKQNDIAREFIKSLNLHKFL